MVGVMKKPAASSASEMPEVATKPAQVIGGDDGVSNDDLSEAEPIAGNAEAAIVAKKPAAHLQEPSRVDANVGRVAKRPAANLAEPLVEDMDGDSDDILSKSGLHEPEDDAEAEIAKVLKRPAARFASSKFKGFETDPGEADDAISTDAAHGLIMKEALRSAESAPKKQRTRKQRKTFANDGDELIAPIAEIDTHVNTPPKGKQPERKPQRVKDEHAPKKPVGGAYGMFAAETRDEFKKEAEAAGDKSAPAVTKLIAAAWKSLNDEQKAPYEEQYKAAKAKYDADIEAYEANQSKVQKAETPTPFRNSARKDESNMTPDDKVSKRKLVTLGPKVAEGIELDEAVLKEADGLGYRALLVNLAQRAEIVERGIDGAKVLRALRASGGRITRAKFALVGF